MKLKIKMNKDFEKSMQALAVKYGEDFEYLNGFHETQTNFSDFIDGFVDKKVADVTIDAKSTTKEFTLSCMSTKKGTITFEVTGDITSGTAETKDISITKNVTVIKASSDKFNIWLIILVIVAISIILIVFLLNKKKNKKDENDNIHSNMNVGLNKKKEIDLEDIE